MLYRSLVHHTTELRRALKSSRDDINELAKTLYRFVRLFDSILREEYTSDHKELDHILLPDQSRGGQLSLNNSASGRVQLKSSTDEESKPHEHNGSPSCNLACDFCGADIFQSFFECRRCRSSDDDLQLGDGLLICPACYVEGRTCLCEDMQPLQCRPFSVLLDDRNRAVEALREANFSADSSKSR